MVNRTRRRTPKALAESSLEELALAYVSRFATSRGKLLAYLRRKLRERGWEGEEPANVAAIADRMVGLGYVDDRAFALGKAQGLIRRGYGQRRLAQHLRSAGIADEDAAEATTHADEQAIASALRFAQRRRLGPFASEEPEPAEREKALAALVRAGHDFALARKIVALKPGSEFVAED
jgi:regulatory protein